MASQYWPDRMAPEQFVRSTSSTEQPCHEWPRSGHEQTNNVMEVHPGFHDSMQRSTMHHGASHGARRGQQTHRNVGR